MANAYDIFSGVCVFVVSVQLLRKVFPWLYENLLGPKLFGSSIRLKEMGSWAGECGVLRVQQINRTTERFCLTDKIRAKLSNLVFLTSES